MKLTFLGAARIVTGSSYLLETGDQKILIDCGMFQGSKTITALNRRGFSYDPTSLNAVILTHAHIDHSGLLPRLCKSGYKGPVYATKVTTELSGIMLPDSGHIQEFDAGIANRKGQRAGKKLVEPLYTVEEAYACLQQFLPQAYNTEIEISPAVTIRFQDAGHMLGSALVEIWVTEGDKKVKLLFSGDLGQNNQPLIKDPTTVETADYVVIESTYGNRKHEYSDKTEVLEKIIKETVERGGNIIIPAFAVGRTQTMLYYLHKLYRQGKLPDIPVILDSPLAIAATEVFTRNEQEYDTEAYDMVYKDHDNPLKMPQLKVTKTSEESKALNNLEQPAVIISASGMADAGRILHHLKHNLWREESSILFVGYQAKESLGRRLLEGVKRVKIMGEEISVRAKIYGLDGFSAHADQDQLLDWLGHVNKPTNVFIVHGEPDMSEPFAQLIREKLNISAYIPNFGDSALIDGTEWKVETSGILPIESAAVIQIRDYLARFEQEYSEYRQRIERLVASDNKKVPDILRRIGKVQAFIKKTFGNL